MFSIWIGRPPRHMGNAYITTSGSVTAMSATVETATAAMIGMMAAVTGMVAIGTAIARQPGRRTLVGRRRPRYGSSGDAGNETEYENADDNKNSDDRRDHLSLDYNFRNIT